MERAPFGPIMGGIYCVDCRLSESWRWPKLTFPCLRIFMNSLRVLLIFCLTLGSNAVYSQTSGNIAQLKGSTWDEVQAGVQDLAPEERIAVLREWVIANEVPTQSVEVAEADTVTRPNVGAAQIDVHATPADAIATQIDTRFNLIPKNGITPEQRVAMLKEAAEDTKELRAELARLQKVGNNIAAVEETALAQPTQTGPVYEDSPKKQRARARSALTSQTEGMTLEERAAFIEANWEALKSGK